MTSTRDSEVKKLIDGFGAVLLLLTFPIFTFWAGFVASTLWRWHVVPQFQVGEIHWTVMSGIFALLSLRANISEKSKLSSWETIAIGVLLPLFSLITGWLALVLR